MKTTLLIVLTALLAACGGSEVNQESQQHQSTKVANTGPVVFIGDSITYRWQFDPTYPTAAVNVGISGQTSVQMHERFASDVLSLSPVAVVLLSGTNDCYLNQGPGMPDTESEIAMVREAQAAGAHVIVGLVPPNSGWIYDPAEGNECITAWNDQLRFESKRMGFDLVDYYDALLFDGHQDTTLFIADGTHPNAAGYTKMWAVLGPVIKLFY